jgi:Zn-dependent peptidase ImmA (M78 family)
MDIERNVKKLVKEYGTNNPFDLAKCLKIDVLTYPMGEDIHGIYVCRKRIKTITLNSRLDEYDALIICAHELGHAVRHTKKNFLFYEKHTLFVKDKDEIEANTFAAHLLLWGKDLSEYQDLTIYQVSSATGVPVELIELVVKKRNKLR